jgi:hypothetical protein
MKGKGNVVDTAVAWMIIFKKLLNEKCEVV